MKRRTILKSILYTIGAIIVVASLALWIFLSFYFDESLNKFVIPKIELATFNATHGRFKLTLDTISYSHGVLVCNTFILSRVAYEDSDHGISVNRLTIDSARFEGISWWDVLCGNDLKLISLRLNAPKLYLTNIGTDSALRRISNSPAPNNAATLPDVPIISFDSIILDDISVFLPKSSGNDMAPTYRNITIRLTDFTLDPKHSTGESALFSKNVGFELPGGSYSIGDSMYSIEVRGIRGHLADSVVTVDSFEYKPNYDEQAFADMHKYIQGRLDFKCSGINIRGINFMKLLSGGGLHVRTCEAASWYVDYYGDLRKPIDPHPPDAVLPNAIINSIKAPVTVDSIVLNNGTIHHRERISGSTHASLLTFTHVHIAANPFSTDTTNPLFNEPLHIDLNALFMGQGKIIGRVVYPIHQKQFDLHIDATVGPFDVPALNSYLITNERKEITKGKCLGGVLRMDVHAGTGVTMVAPQYRDVSIKVLATDAKASSGILEGIKTFVANTFMLRSNNVDDGKNKAIAGTTTYVYSRKEEFFQFIWLALRKSIGKVVGF